MTHKPKGDLTIQFLQDFNAPTPWYFAIIGGTGDYQGAHGQVTYVSDTDNIGRCYSSEAIVLASHGVQQRGGPLVTRSLRGMSISWASIPPPVWSTSASR